MTATLPIQDRLPPNLTRGQVFELAGELGFSVRSVRAVIDGPDASLKGRRLGTKRTYWRKVDVVKFFS